VNREIVVLKFGGTSLANGARVRRAAARVRAQLRRGRAPVVVVSATGGTTDRLLRRFTGLIGAAAPAGREVDRALATGEDLAAALLAVALTARGIAARSLRGGEAGIRATGRFGAGEIERVETGVVKGLIAAGVVPVVSGFQGTDANGETLTLGRGGSDTTAVALAAVLGARECHIVTDVAGVYPADPRRVPCEPFATLGQEELVALSEAGARVVHPAAARLARDAALPLRIYHHAARPGHEAGTRVGAPQVVPLEVVA
jgi:aspartate kinase